MIRNATRADLLNITHIYVDSWRRTYKNTLPADLLSALSYGGAEEKWESYLVKQEQGLFVAEDEKGGVIGFAAYKPCEDIESCLLLDSLHVAFDYQGQRYGKKLILAVCRYAVKNGFRSLAVCVVNGNKKAKNIYLHLGAKHYKDFTDDLGGVSAESEMFLFEDVKAFILQNTAFYLSTKKEDMQPERIAKLLRQSYWAKNRPLDVIKKTIQNSKCYGAFLKQDGRQIGFARVITDYAAIYYVCDVIVGESYRGVGVGSELMAAIESDPDLQGLELEGVLTSLRAQELYAKFGYDIGENPYV